MASGVRGPAGRAVSRGSSASTVPMPTRMPSHRPRNAWTIARDSADESQRSSGVPVANAPSRLMAHLATTHGRPRSTSLRNGMISRLHSSSSRPGSDPDARACSKAAMPPPLTAGKGSREPITTRADARFDGALRCRGASCHDGSRARGSHRAWPRGPGFPPPGARTISACGPPNAACQPSAMMCRRPSASRPPITAPTCGLGSTPPAPRPASSRARVIAAASSLSNITQAGAQPAVQIVFFSPPPPGCSPPGVQILPSLTSGARWLRPPPPGRPENPYPGVRLPAGRQARKDRCPPPSAPRPGRRALSDRGHDPAGDGPAAA